MPSRREFVQVALALGAAGPLFAHPARAFAQQRLREDDLLRFEPLGQVTLLHLTDLHAQLVPLYYREPDVNLGVGDAAGLPPHLTGRALLEAYEVAPGSALAYALSAADYAALAASYGERPGATLLLDGGDTWQGSYTALATRGADMVEAMNLLAPDAMTAHWEFTYGEDRVRELMALLSHPLLAANVYDSEWDEPVFEASAVFERGGVRVGVIGQAFPYTPIANPRHFIPNWSFGIREDSLREHVARLRGAGSGLVVLLSHNGFDVDRKLAGRVAGIDVILTGHTHDALPAAVTVGKTLLIASGSHGKFLSRLDLDVGRDGVRDFRYRLIPVLADAIEPDPEMAALVAKLRAPHAAHLAEVLGTTRGLLYRRGNLNGTFDDLIGSALRAGRDAEVALSPGFRWGGALLPGMPITREDVYNQTAITYPAVYRREMSGAEIKAVLEDVADNLFHPDPYYQQGGDMVRASGLAYRLRAGAAAGSRIEDLRLSATGTSLDPERRYSVAGWGAVGENVEGPPVHDLVADYIAAQGEVEIAPNSDVTLA
jgi:S-sulfosulfanyl-L-cysteine sulfohydrolase